MNWVNLHQHSYYSLLDGLPKPADIASRAKELGMEAIALGDHGAVTVAAAFMKACKKESIKGVNANEFYLCDKEPEIKDASNRQLSHLVVLAKNRDGWKNLIRATSESNKPEFFYYRPRLNLEKLASFSGGNFICFSG